jgi:argininosuccinate lyase
LKREAIAKRLDRGYLDATTLMEYLIRRGVPQRTAHHLVGSLVARAMAQGVRLSDLPLDDFRAADAALDEDVFTVLGVENAIRAFASDGSTAPQAVARQVAHWRVKLGLSDGEPQ